ncbi:hypothetical protein TrVFT333_002960 [Trichoderma virens FT-333]|nr:hypothetical protein TrVFT333_002960 [Trichoderma virens FT-333]
MAAVVDPLRYNNLVSLGEADTARQAPFVDDTINGPIRDVFIKHGVQDIFCLYLQHRHHTIDEGQVVVKVNGTAHLMNGQAMNDIVAFGNKSFSLHLSCLLIKFLLIRELQSAESRCPEPDFVKELVSVLASNGCNDMFGIDTMAEGPWTEMSIGSASVMVPDKNIS